MIDSHLIKNSELSIVIASQNAQTSATKCLQKIEDQCELNNIEIIVVDNSCDETTELISSHFPSIKLIKCSTDKLIPELWGIGISASRGKFIALTTTHFIPANNWVAEVLKAQSSEYAGIGGAIENDKENNLVSWAVYFCRYSRYMLPFVKTDVEDFAADNSSYKRANLERTKFPVTDGFWEVFAHKKMLKENMRLCLTPEIVVFHQNSFTFSEFVVQRFHHGKQFGRMRIADISKIKRLVLIILGPLIPFIFLYRITRRILAKRKNITKYIQSLPILFLFLTSWSIGEVCGYLAGNENSK